MRERNQTTVVLTKKAQDVKDDLAPVFGLKNILSVGVLLFGRLSSDEQKQLIAEVNEVKLARPQTIRDVLRNVVKKSKESQGSQIELPHSIIKLLPTDKKLWAEFERLLSPEPQKKKSKRG